MQHTIEDLIKRINAMADKANTIKKLREEFIHSDRDYDRLTCNELLADIQAMALTISRDKEGTEILSEIDP